MLQADDCLARCTVEQACDFSVIKTERAQLRLQRHHIFAEIACGKDILRGDGGINGRGKRGAAHGKHRENAEKRG